MNRSVARLTTGALLAAVLAISIHVALATQAAESAQPPVRLTMLASSGPHTIRAGTLLTVHLRVRGLDVSSIRSLANSGKPWRTGRDSNRGPGGSGS